jgi:phosphoribosylanthranilate isomerase
MIDRIQLPRVKVCGLTNQHDVDAALACGADALGVVLHPESPRCVNLAQLGEIFANSPMDVPRVGVFVHTDQAAAAELVRTTPLNWVQLCGPANPADWVGFDAPILRRIPVGPGAEQMIADWHGIARGFVLDHPSTPGGSGQAVDWNLAKSLCASAPCLLAGGLHGENVVAAVGAVQPRGVDAASRLESSPGIKDPERLSSYVLKALTALSALSQ